MYPIDEVVDFESQALRSATSESASDVVLPNGSKLIDAREISYMTGLPLYIVTQKQMRDALGIPNRRVQKLIRFNRDEVMVWSKRWLQDAKDKGIDLKADPASQRRSLLHTLASLPV